MYVVEKKTCWIAGLLSFWQLLFNWVVKCANGSNKIDNDGLTITFSLPVVNINWIYKRIA